MVLLTFTLAFLTFYPVNIFFKVNPIVVHTQKTAHTHMKILCL